MKIINFVLTVIFYVLLICRINEVFVCSWWWIFVPVVLAFCIGLVNSIRKQIAINKTKERTLIMEKIRRERMIYVLF